LQDGGYRYPWASVHILAPLFLGIAVIAAFIVWEGWFTPQPMIPKIIFTEEKAIGLALIVATAGGNYFLS